VEKLLNVLFYSFVKNTLCKTSIYLHFQPNFVKDLVFRFPERCKELEECCWNEQKSLIKWSNKLPFSILFPFLRNNRISINQIYFYVEKLFHLLFQEKISRYIFNSNKILSLFNVMHEWLNSLLSFDATIWRHLTYLTLLSRQSSRKVCWKLLKRSATMLSLLIMESLEILNNMNKNDKIR